MLQQHGHLKCLTPTRALALVEEEKEESDNDTIVGMAKAEANTLLEMCGKIAGGDPSLFPSWVTDTCTKSLSKSYKLQVVHKHIMSTYYYEDADY